MRSSAKYRPFEISHVSVGDYFAAMQIDLNVRGWKTLGGFAALKVISSQTIASSNESTSRSLRSHLHQRTLILYHINFIVSKIFFIFLRLAKK